MPEKRERCYSKINMHYYPAEEQPAAAGSFNKQIIIRFTYNNQIRITILK